MSEAEIGQNIVPWKNEASEQAILAGSRVEEAALDSDADGMKRGVEEEREFMNKAADQFRGDRAATFLFFGIVLAGGQTLTFTQRGIVSAARENGDGSGKLLDIQRDWGGNAPGEYRPRRCHAPRQYRRRRD